MKYVLMFKHLMLIFMYFILQEPCCNIIVKHDVAAIKSVFKYLSYN